MVIRIRYFAGVKDALERAEDELDWNSTNDHQQPVTVNQIINHLEAQHPQLKDYLPHCLITRNLEFVDRHNWNNIVVEDGDELALIPPISGG